MNHEEAIARVWALGLHPIPEPLGNAGHHTEEPFSKEDEETGDALAWFLGTMWDHDRGNHEFSKRTSSEEWQRVARALRIHGLRIADR